MKSDKYLPAGEQITADLNEMLFEGRNKAYGSYQLRQKYHKWLMNSFLLAAIVFISSILFWYMTFSDSGEENPMVAEAQKELRLREFAVETRKLDAKPVRDDHPLRKKALPTSESNISAQKEPVWTEAPQLKTDRETELLVDSLQQRKVEGLHPPIQGLTPRKPGDLSHAVPIRKAVRDPLLSYAEYPALPLNLNDVRQDIGYPQQAARMGLEGEVSLKVLVGEDGEYVRHEVEDFTHPIFLESCERHVKKLRFSPGKMGKEPVKVWVSIPFRFRL